MATDAEVALTTAKATLAKATSAENQQAVVSAEAQKAALIAVIALERSEDAGKKSTAEWTQAAKETVRLQRLATREDAKLTLERAKVALQAAVSKKSTSNTELEKKVATADTALKVAVTKCSEPETTAYTPAPDATAAGSAPTNVSDVTTVTSPNPSWLRRKPLGAFKLRMRLR